MRQRVTESDKVKREVRKRNMDVDQEITQVSSHISSQHSRGRQIYESEVTLVYIEISRLAKFIQRTPIAKDQENRPN